MPDTQKPIMSLEQGELIANREVLAVQNSMRGLFDTLRRTIFERDESKKEVSDLKKQLAEALKNRASRRKKK